MIRWVLLVLFVILLLPVPNRFSGGYQILLQATGIVLTILFLARMALSPRSVRFYMRYSLDAAVILGFVVFPFVFFMFGLSANNVSDNLVDLFKFGIVAVVYMLFREFFTKPENREFLASYLSRFVVPVALLVFVWLSLILPRVAKIGLYRTVSVPATIASILFATVLIAGTGRGRTGFKLFLWVLITAVCALTLGRLMTFSALMLFSLWLFRKKLLLSSGLRRILAGALLVIIAAYPFWLVQKKNLKTEDLSVWWRQNEWSYVMKLAQKDTITKKLFGHGFGFALAAGTPLESADGITYYELPNLHSLWLFVYVKTGLLGIVLLLYFLIIVWKQFERAKEKEVLSLLLLFSVFMGFSLAGSVTGFFTQSYLQPFLLGINLAAFEGITGRRETCVF
ncbi:MAG: hypothetical protein GXO69_08030 [Acidobacteria bacterium]|nr:hypothetical protein [Acidobacteriota bacterium]